MSEDDVTTRVVRRADPADEGSVGSDSAADRSVGGTYTLIIDLPEATTVDVGALGEHRFPAGGYAYTGSALGTGGFSRVDRHARIARGEHDVRHWHVDYLLGTPESRIAEVVRSDGVDVECSVAERLPKGPLDGFGSSDCGCRSHLSRDDDVASLSERVTRAHDAVASSRNDR